MGPIGSPRSGLPWQHMLGWSLCYTTLCHPGGWVPQETSGRRQAMQVRLDDGAELFYTIDDFTDPWTQPETVVLHHGMAKNHKL